MQSSAKNRGLARRVLIFAGAMLAAALPVRAGYDSVPVDDGGFIDGRIIYAGKQAAKNVTINIDKAICAKHGPIPEEDLVVAKDSGLQYAVVYLADITSGRSLFSMAPPVLEQSGCRFQPHVLVVPVGKPLTVRNSDGLLHNIHTHSVKNRQFNLAQPGSVPQMTLGQFTAPELVDVTCDAHGWMSAKLWVTNNPYAVVTAQNGAYKIPDIPPGKYRLEVWHETLGKVTREVTVNSGKETRLDLVFPALPAKTATSGSK